MPATEREHDWTVALRRKPADPGNSNPASGTFEIICQICGDEPTLAHQEISVELQQIRGPYTLSGGIAAFIKHNEFHGGTDEMQSHPA